MNNKEKIINMLEGMGLKPKYDEDGNIGVRYQMKILIFIVSEDDEVPFVRIYLPQFYDIEGDETIFHHALCNKMCQELGLVKVFIDKNSVDISATYEFYLTSDEALEFNIKQSLRIMAVIRSLYRRYCHESSGE